jgi:hypothetical protein
MYYVHCKIPINMEKYEALHQKLQEGTITPNELKLLNHLAFGTPFMNSNNKGTKVKYY